jgi:predicted HTH domain antitoxin
MEITLEIPESIGQALRLPRRGTKNELMRLLAITLYERGILGIGKSRELAGLTKLEFFAMLKNEGIAINYSEEEVKADLAALEALPE